jgi:hypothetical protein
MIPANVLDRLSKTVWDIRAMEKVETENSTDRCFIERKNLRGEVWKLLLHRA